MLSYPGLWQVVLGLLLLVLSGSLTACGSAPATPTAENSLGDALFAATEPPRITPHPGYSPQDVVRIQLNALQHNDTPTPDSGIRWTFRFASPDNRAVTGPEERFIDLVKTPDYRDLLNFQRAEFAEPRIEGDQAVQEVTIVSASGQVVTYGFLLSRQAEPPYEDCWMTDGVVRLQAPPLQSEEI
jgi:hypothetical protein